MRQRQKGFTLLEIVLVSGIVGAIVVVVGMTTMNLMMNYQRPSTQQILLQQVQNAGYQMPRDINMSSNVTLTGPNGFPLTINIPVDQDENNNYNVTYLFDSDNLKRQQFDSSDNLVTDTVIAQYVDTDNTTCDNLTGSLYKLTIRVFSGEESVTVSYEARQRLAAEAE
ncbi:prepilin-type N-terminal cleavage/methylation domain-containing protein [Chloroflexota bacterium]